MSVAVEATEAPETPEVPAPRRRRLVPILAGVVLLAALGGGGWYFFLRPHGDAPPPKPVEEEVRSTFSLGSVVVNLKGEARRYLRVSVSLGLPSEKMVKVVEEAKPQLLDLCITVLTSTESETLLSAEGREKVKEALIERIRREPGMKNVMRVYFTEFVVQ